MMNVQNETPNIDVKTSSTQRSARHMQVFLIWVLFGCAYDIVIYQLSFHQFSLNLVLSSLMIFIISLFGIALLQYQLRSGKIKPQYLDLSCQLLSLGIGIGLGISTYVIYAYLPTENLSINHIHLLVLSVLPVSIIYIIAFTYLTQRLRYFLLIFIPSALPFLCTDYLYPYNVPDFFSLVVNSWLIVVLIAAILSFNIHRRLNTLDERNSFMLQRSYAHAESSNVLERKLKEQAEKSLEIRQQLLLNNEHLEQKVQERVTEIEQINDRLENHQANLTFAHETAGISSWLWNIERRTLEISTAKHDLDFDYFSNHSLQLEDLVHPDDLENYRFKLRQHLRGHTDRFAVNYRIKRSGEWYWIQDIGKIVSRDPKTRKPLRMVGIFRDINKEKKDQEQLKLAANVFDQVAEGIFVLDSQLCYIDVNPYYAELIGFQREELIGKHLFDITINHAVEVQQLHHVISQQLKLTGEYDSEIQEEFISGKKLSLWLHINAIRDDKHNIVSYVGITTDLTERKKQEQRLNYLENYDLLTDLPNRFYFNLKLHQYINNHPQLKHFAIIRLNIDRFRLFNEFLNHHAGDELLRQVAHRLRTCCQNAQLVAYLNNDDFAVIYNVNNHNFSIHHKARAILEAFAQPFNIDGQDQGISISIGIALYPEHGRQIDSLMSHADMALADAKGLGGNTIRFYNTDTSPLFDDSVLLKRDLQDALKKQQLLVYYQPQICSTSLNIIGFEALVRWQHPTRGLISPERFIPLAEETSLISEIGQFVLLESCRQIQIWRKLGFKNIRVSVNIVAQQIHRGQLLTDLDAAMQKYQVSGAQLELELTEGSLLDYSEHVIDLLSQVKQRNISISLDDFGTGYSSLAYLSKFPIGTLKIDKAFISKIGHHKDAAIVDAIIAMGKAMGMLVIAEGVETRAQVEYLQQQGCDVLQGFYFSKPLSALETTQYLNQYRADLSSSSH